MTYVKAKAEIIVFDNQDVITTSGLDETNGGGSTGCRTPGHDRGNGCSSTSGTCPGKAWK